MTAPTCPRPSGPSRDPGPRLLRRRCFPSSRRTQSGRPPPLCYAVPSFLEFFPLHGLHSAGPLRASRGPFLFLLFLFLLRSGHLVGLVLEPGRWASSSSHGFPESRVCASPGCAVTPQVHMVTPQVYGDPSDAVRSWLHVELRPAAPCSGRSRRRAHVRLPACFSSRPSS